ncbi:MAG: alpha/beta hydrolase [Firmicutes bacterium]|nr:alpha/beta hydrolase [Bacillota bacterium]
MSRGMVAIVADYRVALRHGTTWFDSVRDAKSAIRWVREHADELGIDPDRIVAAGGSAGGHLAAAAALVEGYDDEPRAVSARPNALILFNPALDLTAFPVPDHWLERSTDISPLHQVGPGAPPTLVLHGTSDMTVPFAQAVQFCAAMEEAGNRCELQTYPGRGHGFFNYRPRTMDDFVDTLRRADRFLVSLGYLAEP